MMTAKVSIQVQRKPGNVIPVLTVVMAIILVWYAGAIYLNSPQIIERYEKKSIDWTVSQLASDSWNMKRAVLPSPHQVAVELKKTIVDKNITSKRSLVYHAGITLSSTLLGFVLGAGLGVILAVGIVYVETLDKSLMPWIITSQTIPILALAPMVIVVFGALGITGLLPKSLISMYLCFFPVAVGMVKGLRSPQPMLLDLLNTYSASRWQVFWRLRLPSAAPFLFASLKVAIAASLVGAIVAELPTGGQSGLGSRLLSGSYYGQTNLIWAALIVAAVMSAGLVSLVGVIERKVCRRLAGGQEVSHGH
ncbi:MAG: ABC transporter permease [Gammaproteobacteria bacterium]|jgi:NitT/TauT family transport system permease protein|nr:ABC transporter permease [Gammaproteobacteria bacterium]